MIDVSTWDLSELDYFQLLELEDRVRERSFEKYRDEEEMIENQIFVQRAAWGAEQHREISQRLQVAVDELIYARHIARRPLRGCSAEARLSMMRDNMERLRGVLEEVAALDVPDHFVVVRINTSANYSRIKQEMVKAEAELLAMEHLYG